jgi:hypothetical protein
MLEDRWVPAVLTVNTAADETTADAFLSLREAVNVVNAQSTVGLSAAELAHISGALGVNDTIQFSPSLVGKTIPLTSGEIAIDIGLTIQGLGATKLAVSGNNASRIFNIGPDSSGVTISGLTLVNGRSIEGGAILDDGSSLTLTSDRLINNQAVGLAAIPFVSPAGDGLGGALAILCESTAGMSVNITSCRFTNNTAQGGVGAAAGFASGGQGEGGAIFLNADISAGLVFNVRGTNFSVNSAFGRAGAAAESFGGNAQGGAVSIDAGFASLPDFVLSSDTFTGCAAAGGAGGNGAGLSPGGPGGAGNGGALSYTADFAAAPSLTVTTSTFTGNDAQGGKGGVGAAPTDQAGSGGGVGGFANGGAVFADFQNSAGASDTFTGDTFHLNGATGGAGGAGGASVQAAGGAGGLGGEARGGAMQILSSGFASGTLLSIAQSAITQNGCSGGAGGAGGSGFLTGGAGADGGLAFGGGLELANRFGAGQTWTLNSDTIALNQANGGNGGAGGAGIFGGNGGTGMVAAAGGIDDEFTGTLLILHCSIVFNSAASGQGGVGGISISPELGAPGAPGGTVPSDAGGLHIVIVGKACASIDTLIADNHADTNPNVDGMLGTC